MLPWQKLTNNYFLKYSPFNISHRHHFFNSRSNIGLPCISTPSYRALSRRFACQNLEITSFFFHFGHTPTFLKLLHLIALTILGDLYKLKVLISKPSPPYFLVPLESLVSSHHNYFACAHRICFLAVQQNS